MKLKVRDVELSTGGPLIAVLNEEDARKLDLYALDRIKITRDKKNIIASIDIAIGKRDINVGEIGLFNEVVEKLKVKPNQLVEISIEKRPNSLEYIKRKLDGEKLNENEISEIIKDVVDNKLSEVELTFFVAGCYANQLDMKETIALTKALAASGSKLNLKKDIIVDKHSSGGVVGNRTTMIIVPIIAAAGLTIPKTSSRAITSPAGTADTMEVLAPVSLQLEKIKKVVEKTNGCIIWGGAMELASADNKLIKIEHPLRLDPEGVLLSSIMAKKAAVGATHVLIDIPVGPETKIKTMDRAKRLRKKFIKLAKYMGIKVNVIITDGSEPIGKGIGPCLEARDVLWVLQNDGKAPQDLKEKAVKMAGLILKMIRKGDEKTAKEILESGKAYEKMKEIIKAQGGNPEIQPEEIKIGKFSYVVRCKKNGVVKDVDNSAIAKIARIAGAPKDKEAGIYLNIYRGDKVKVGDILLTVYSKSGKKLNYTLDVFKTAKVVEIE